MSKKITPMWSITLIGLFHYLALDASRPFLSLRAAECGADGLQIGFVTAAYSIIQVACALLVGKALDTWGYRKPTLIGATSFVAGAVLLAFTDQIPLIVVSAVLMGISHGIILLSGESMMTGFRDAAQRAKGVGMFTFCAALAMFAGPTVGGWMQAWLGSAHAFLGSAALHLVSLVLSFFLPDKAESPNAEHQPTETSAKLLSDGRILTNILLSACVFFSLDILSTYLPLYCSQVGLATVTIGYILSAKGMAQMLVRVSLGKLCQIYRKDRIFSLCLSVGAISTALLGFANTFGSLLIVSVVVGLALGLANPLTLMTVSEVASENNRGRVLALRVMFNYGAQAASPIIFGLLADAAGLSPVFWGSGSVMMLCVFLSRFICAPKEQPLSRGM